MNNKYNDLVRLLSNRNYIDFVIDENIKLPGETEELKADIKMVVNTCIINSMELVGADEKELEDMKIVLG